MASAALPPLKFVRSVFKSFMSQSGLEPRLFGTHLRLTDARHGKIAFELDITKDHTNRLQMLHGGTIASMVDFGGSLAVASMGLHATGVTTDLNITYLRKGGRIGDKLWASAQCDRIGQNLAFTSIDFRNSKNEIVARGTHTKYIKKAHKEQGTRFTVPEGAEIAEDGEFEILEKNEGEVAKNEDEVAKKTEDGEKNEDEVAKKTEDGVAEKNEAAASIAATAAGLTYLDGKYHIRQDWQLIRAKKKGYKLLQKALEEKRISPYYFFERRAQSHPSKECIWTRDGSLTRAEAYWRANQFAQFFLARGVRPGDLVALFMANSADFVLAWMGLWAVGAAPALINHNLTRQALLHCLGVAGSSLLLADGPPALLERLDAVAADLADRGVRIVRLDGDSEDRAALNGTRGDRPPDELREGVRPDSPFGLFYTSGTTGLPKACVVPAVAGFMHGCSRECGFAYVRGGGGDEDQRYYDCMPLYHGTGGISAMTQLLTGHTLCIAPKFSVSAFWDDIRASRATWFVYVGETLRYLLAAPPSPRDREHSVRGLYGNGLRPDVWVPFRERFGIDTIHEFFNSTEGILPLDNPARGDFRAHSVGHHGLLERFRHRDALVPVEVDPDTGDIARDPRTGFARRVPHRVGGEILVRQPPTVTPPFPGYFKNPDATEAKYVRDVFEKGDCYYRTGDALRRDDNGRWFFLDRLGDTFRWKGENVSTAEVSEVLGSYPGIGEATVYGVSLPGHDGKAGMAAVYIDQAVANGKFDYAGLLAHARTHLPKYAVPIFIREIKERSATHNNKQDKVPLKRAGVDPAQTGTDPVFWISELGKGSTYVPFTASDWEGLQGGKAKLLR